MNSDSNEGRENDDGNVFCSVELKQLPILLPQGMTLDTISENSLMVPVHNICQSPVSPVTTIRRIHRARFTGMPQCRRVCVISTRFMQYVALVVSESPIALIATCRSPWVITSGSL